MAHGDSYALPRNATETQRLNVQHKHLTKCLSFLIHPSIPTDKPGLRVADVACGSGIWLTDVATKHPQAICDGFDISGDQFPPRDKLRQDFGDRVHFHVRDAADTGGYGSELEGQFDVVAVRLMHVSIIGSQWSQAVKNAVSLLRPGGWLQWVDWDPQTAHFVQTKPSPPRAALDELWSGFQQFLATRDTGATAYLPQMMRNSGLVEVRSEIYANDPDHETRRFFHTTLVSSAPGVIEKTLLEKDGSGWDMARLDRVRDQAERQIEGDGVFLRHEFLSHIGMKPH